MDYGDAVATASNVLLASYEDALQREKFGRGAPTPQKSPWLSLQSPPAWPHEQRADPQLKASGWPRPLSHREANFGAPRSSLLDSHVAGRDLQALQDKQDQLLAELGEVKSLIVRRDAEMEALHHEVATLLRRSAGVPDWRTLSTVSAGLRSQDLGTPTMPRMTSQGSFHGRPSPILEQLSAPGPSPETKVNYSGSWKGNQSGSWHSTPLAMSPPNASAERSMQSKKGVQRRQGKDEKSWGEQLEDIQGQRKGALQPTNDWCQCCC